MPPRLKRTIYTGTFIHTPTLGNLEIIEYGAVGVDENGIIRFVEELPENRRERAVAKRVAEEHGWDDGVDVVVGWQERSSFWFPGFVGRSWLLFFNLSFRVILYHEWIHPVTSWLAGKGECKEKRYESFVNCFFFVASCLLIDS